MEKEVATFGPKYTLTRVPHLDHLNENRHFSTQLQSSDNDTCRPDFLYGLKFIYSLLNCIRRLRLAGNGVIIFIFFHIDSDQFLFTNGWLRDHRKSPQVFVPRGVFHRRYWNVNNRSTFRLCLAIWKKHPTYIDKEISYANKLTHARLTKCDSQFWSPQEKNIIKENKHVYYKFTVLPPTHENILWIFCVV